MEREFKKTFHFYSRIFVGGGGGENRKPFIFTPFFSERENRNKNSIPFFEEIPFLGKRKLKNGLFSPPLWGGGGGGGVGEKIKFPLFFPFQIPTDKHDTRWSQVTSAI